MILESAYVDASRVARGTKILHVTPSYYPATYWGGPIFSVYALNNALACLPDFSLTVLTTDTAGPQLADRLDTANLAGLYPSQKVIMTRRVAGASVSLELLQKVSELVRWADVVHLTGTYSFPTIPTLVLCRMFNKPLVWSPRGAIQDAHEWEGSRRRRLKRVWDRTCNALIRRGRVITHTTSERERLATQERLPRATAVIVPNGVNVLDVLPQRDWLPDGRLRLMYLGRLSPKKAIENLLHAIHRMDDPGISLTIYGAGDVAYTESLNELAEHLGLLGRSVVFAGNIDGEAKSAAFHTADVCVVPSHTENFCMVVAEALAHGVPVIASRGTPWAAVEEKRCGLWVDNSPESLAQAIIRIRTMTLMDMGERGRHWMTREFSWDALAKKMAEIYRSLASR
jgi:glycosyltransferase involved in cell wall biosynthesis